MTYPRSQTISQTEDGHYHVISACVRNAFLLSNTEPEKYNCRKQWIQDKMISLSRIFYIDIFGYALMDTHMHLLLGTRYFQADHTTRKDVATRWLTLHPKRRNKAPSEKEINELVNNKKEVENCRKKLRDVSIFMKELNQHIARRANKEDNMKGRFWQGRFESISLPDSGAILKCLMYVELKPVRAKIAEAPETSKYTSCYDRIKAHNARKEVNKSKKNKKNPKIMQDMEKDNWLAPIFDTTKEKGFFHMTFEEYLELLDWTGREIRDDKRGAISDDLAPILKRLKLKTDNWTEHLIGFRKDFRRVAGSEETIRKYAKKANKHWFHGISAANQHFI